MKSILFAAMLIAASSLSPALAADTDKAAGNTDSFMMSKEDRQKMATMHEGMATCLRSDKDLKLCHEEMKKDCQASGMACPMMGKGMGQGMHRGKHKM